MSRLPRGIIQQEMQASRLRSDLDPKLITLSLLSVTIFPMLALPVAGLVFDYGLDKDSIQRLLQHNTRLFEGGTRAR